MLIAIMILLIAYLNYVNLTTAISSRRAREVGIRKVMGSFRTQLLQQFLIESFLINMISLSVACIFVLLTQNYLSELVGIYFTISTDPMFWLMVFGIVLVGSICSGLYPAIRVGKGSAKTAWNSLAPA